MDFVLITVLIGVVSGFPADDCSNKPADVVFVLDSSNSVWLEDFKKQTAFVKEVVQQFDVGPGPTQTRVAALTFGHDVWKQFTLNEILVDSDLFKAIDSIEHGRGRMTNTGGAINFALDKMLTREAGSRDGVTKVMIVITDGRSQKTRETKQAALRAHAANLTMFAIGVGRNLDLLELSDIASNPDTDYLFMVDDFNALPSVTKRLARKTCAVSTPVPTTLPPTTTKATEPSDQSHLGCGRKPAEIFFIIDSSGSITGKDFNKEINFVQSVIKVFDIGRDKTRIGLVSFSHETYMDLPLNNSLTKQQILDKLDSIFQAGGGTNTAMALRMVRQQGFDSSVVRPEAAKIAIVLTDGLSADEDMTEREARLIHELGVTVFAIGIGKGVDQFEIKSIASDPNDRHAFQVDDFSSLETIKDLLAIKTCAVKPNDLKDSFKDQPFCQVKKASDLMFVYDATAMGVHVSNAIAQFLSSVVSSLDVRSGQLHIGRITDDCPTAGNIQLTNKLTPLDFSKFQLSSYSHMLGKLRRAGFTVEYGGRNGASKVAVLFVDANMDGLDEKVLEEARLLKTESEVFIVTLGNSDIVSKISKEFGNGYHHHVNSYRDLNNGVELFLTKLCDFFTFAGMDYNVDYVVPV